MARWFVISSLLLALGAAVPAWADDREDCKNAASLAKTDPARAAAACRVLAGQGVAAAQYILGLLYGLGRGVPEDDVQSYMWLDLAAARGNAAAVKARDDLFFVMTPAQVAQAKSLVAAWKPTTGQ